MAIKKDSIQNDAAIHNSPHVLEAGGKSVHFNLDVQRFCLVGELDSAALELIIADYERITLAEFLSPLLLRNGTDLPPLMDPCSSGKSFRRILRPVVEKSVPLALRSLDAVAIAEYVRTLSEPELTTLLRSITPASYSEARETLHARYSKQILSFEPRELFQHLRGNNRITTPAGFLEWMCTLGNHRNRPYPFQRVIQFLQIANLHRKLLFPFALFRNSLDQRRRTWGSRDAQRFLASATSQRFMSNTRYELLMKFQRQYQVSWKRNINEATRCFAFVLLACDADTISELDVEALRAIRTAYGVSDGFAAKKPHARKEAAALLGAVYRIIAKELAGTCNQPTETEKQSARSKIFHKLTEKFITPDQAGELAKGTGSFFWLEQRQPEYAEWARCFRDFVKVKLIGNKDSFVGLLNVFCNYLAEHKPLIYSPSAFERHHVTRRPGTNISVTYKEYLDTKYNRSSQVPTRALYTLQDFFDWHIAEFDETRTHPVVRWDISSLPEYQGKTEKTALPVRILKLMKNILVENDFAWAKSIEDDYIRVFNPESNKIEELWCPARAVALTTLLTIPLRSIQVRLLDSGQGDEYIYDPRTHSFISNPVGQSGRRLGVLREIFDSTTQVKYVGLFINTNKTKKIYTKGKKGGYEILWENKELIALFTSLRDWQDRYNPCPDPVHINDLTDRSLHCTDAVAPFIPRYFFLFRDPCTKGPNEPISYVRLCSMFLLLLAETERRLRDQGDPVTLISEWEQKSTKQVPSRGVITLHSLRVSGLTAFAEAGVPLQILADFLAGHATILMTLYYQKFGASKVSHIIDKAAQIMENESGMESYLEFLEDNAESYFAQIHNSAGGEVSPLSDLLVPASNDAVENLRRNERGFWHIDIDGICPNGRTLCQSGGPHIGTKGWTRSTPVPGGNGNCPRCRYWVTGPMFLFGQLVKTNVLLYHLSEKAKHLVKLEDELTDLQDVLQPGPNNRHRIHEVRSSIEVINQEIENLLATWVKRYEYAVASAALLNHDNAKDSEAPHALIVNDPESIEVALREAHEFELLEFVNNTCEVFQGIDSLSAKLKKAKLLDMLLDRNNMESFLFKLPDELALKVGNKLTRFLYDNLNQQAVHDLMDGKQTLRELGLDHSFTEQLKAIQSTGLSTPFLNGPRKKDDSTDGQ